MTNWPDKPLIRVIRGKVDGDEITDELAIHRGNGEYILFAEKHWHWTVAANCCDDSIDKWEEVTDVPTAALKRLQDAFRGVDMVSSLVAAVQDVTSHLPADKPSALDRAVTRVKDVGDTPMVDADSLPADRLSLLLDALASVQSAARKTLPLIMVTRICADWVQADNPEKIALEQMRSRALSIPEVVGSDPARFIVLAGYIGDAANMLSNAHLDVSGQLTNAGTYALAWAAQTIEEEDQ